MHDSHVECTVREELQRLKSLPFFFGFWWERKRKKRKYIYVHIYIYISLLCYSIFYILQVVIDGINVNVSRGLVRRYNNWVVHGLKRGSLHLSLSGLLLNYPCLCLSLSVSVKLGLNCRIHHVYKKNCNLSLFLYSIFLEIKFCMVFEFLKLEIMKNFKIFWCN